MEEERLTKTLNALAKRFDDTLAHDCVKSVKNEVIFFHPGFISEKEGLYRTYKIRYKIAKDDMLDSPLTEEDLIYWEKALSAIKLRPEESITLVVIRPENYTYLVFLTVDLEEAIGIIRLSNEKSSNGFDEYYHKLIKSGNHASAGMYKFKNGLPFE